MGERKDSQGQEKMKGRDWPGHVRVTGLTRHKAKTGGKIRKAITLGEGYN